MSREFLTVAQTAERYPAFTQSTLRFYIFHEKTNGFDRVVRRVGRKVLVDVTAFEDWIDSNPGSGRGSQARIAPRREAAA